MRIGTLALREILYRWKSVAAGIAAVALATGVLAGTLNLLKTYDTCRSRTIAEMKAELDQRVTALNEDIRSAMNSLGFNLVIIPAGQNLGDYYAEDYAQTLMPEEYLDRLARADLDTISHLLPRLRWRVRWPETKWTVSIVGGAQQASTFNGTTGDPAFASVPGGCAELGYEIHRALGYTTGQTVRIMGTDFRVSGCIGERGTKDDITIWLNLRNAQELLGKPGQINEILALETERAWTNFNLVRAEIGAILPDTQVIEYGETLAAMIAARTQTVMRGEVAIALEEGTTAARQRSMKAFALVLVPIVIMVCGVWLIMVMLDNVRSRRQEIGILSAVGYRLPQIMGLFMLRAVPAGILGGVLGFAFSGITGSYSLELFGIAVGTACLIAFLATALPAVYTVLVNPADILRN